MYSERTRYIWEAHSWRSQSKRRTEGRILIRRETNSFAQEISLTFGDPRYCSVSLVPPCCLPLYWWKEFLKSIKVTQNNSHHRNSTLLNFFVTFSCCDSYLGACLDDRNITEGCKKHVIWAIKILIYCSHSPWLYTHLVLHSSAIWPQFPN